MPTPPSQEIASAWAKARPVSATMRQEALLADHLPHMLERRQRRGERGVAGPLMQDLPRHQQGDGEQQRAAQGADGGHRPRCLASRRS